jgi:prepilin-type N-terminal cleavage/methylation domain-containing protein
MNQRGFTLMETLVAITVAAVVLAGLATTVSGHSRAAIFQMGTADVSQNVRGALDVFKREMRMAGHGMGAVPTNVLEPVLVQAAGAGEVSRVRLRGAFTNLCPANPAPCVEGFGSAVAGSTTITIAPCPTVLTAFTPGKYVAIESAILGVAEVHTIASWNSATCTLAVTSPPLPSTFQYAYDAGSPVRQIDDVLYVLDSQGVLKRNGAIVADQITGANALTLQYILADGTTVANPTAVLDTLRGATIRIQASGTTNSGLTPQADLTAQVRIRNLAIATAPAL